MKKDLKTASPKRVVGQTVTRRRKPAKRQRHMAYSQVGGVSPGLIVGIGKAGLIWDHQSVGGLSNQASDQNCRKT